jgi:hypothetical protein
MAYSSFVDADIRCAICGGCALVALREAPSAQEEKSDAMRWASRWPGSKGREQPRATSDARGIAGIGKNMGKAPKRHNAASAMANAVE